MKSTPTFCRICQAACGLIVDVEDNRVVAVQPDPDNALSQGFTCPKGRRYGDLHHHPGRLSSSLRRERDGSRTPLSSRDAIAEAGSRLRDIVAEHGPDAVAMFIGTQTYFNATTLPLAYSWFEALGSIKKFSTMTIDQSAKWVTLLRMGSWNAGLPAFDDIDACIVAGSNPVVSVTPTTGLPWTNPVARIRAARARGMQLIVIDPRRTETAAMADIHLQLIPGRDPVLLASLLHVIFAEGLDDTEFCSAWTVGADALRTAVEPFEPARAAALAGVDAGALREAARVFAIAPRSFAAGGTGPDMAPGSNVTEHLLACLNAVCGRYLREGDTVANPGVRMPKPPPLAEAVAPFREWEHGARSRVRGVGTLMGELPSGILADEILEPGPDRVRALVVVGGNPAVALPDRDKARRALSSLDLLVTIDPFLSDTAALADYVIAPTMAFERPDATNLEMLFPVPFSQYSVPLLEPAPGLVDDWEVFWGFGEAMGLELKLGPMPLGKDKPTTADLLALLSAAGSVPFATISTAPHGDVFDLPPLVVGPASDAGKTNRLDLFPDDVAAEFAAAVGAATADDLEGGFTHRLVVRRMREVMNSLGTDVEGLPRQPFNPLGLHPDDVAALGVEDRAIVRVTSSAGTVLAVVHADPTVRPGAASLSHCWPATDGDHPSALASVLVSSTEAIENINAMPRLSAIPVRIEPASAGR
jgi:anaerobic selenocysteine-containing dehydrogenase